MRDIEDLFKPNNHSNFQIVFEDVAIPHLEILRNNYGINFTSAQRIKDGSINSQAYKLSSENTDYVLLISPNTTTTTQQKIATQVKLYESLRRRNVKVPEIILPNSQTSGYIQIGDTFAILSAFVPGNHFEGSLNQLQNAGRQVAILTNALKEETPSFQTQVSAYFNVHAKYRGINDLQQALDLVKKNKDSKPHPYLDLILSREEDLRNICIAMDAKYEHISTTQIVHGDLHPHNFIGNEPYITDLGEIRLAPVIEDIGFALHRLVRQGVAYQNQISKSEAVAQSAKAFISGFTKVSSLPSDVITGATQVAIKKVVRATNLWFTDWQGDKQGDKWLGQMPKFIDSLDEIAYIEKAIHD